MTAPVGHMKEGGMEALGRSTNRRRRDYLLGQWVVSYWGLPVGDSYLLDENVDDSHRHHPPGCRLTLEAVAG